ncbi:unnamed protein product [Nesidiocoris tenuis]|uniref:Uncharacterized protein n=1 Tax=Nesidiocoris tenuis TaxID=355587 RepID=A0A6H5FW40_9HEMI|nr:unnamed protein product [Nesidiocoris tenuis]
MQGGQFIIVSMASSDLPTISHSRLDVSDFPLDELVGGSEVSNAIGPGVNRKAEARLWTRVLSQIWPSIYHDPRRVMSRE